MQADCRGTNDAVTNIQKLGLLLLCACGFWLRFRNLDQPSLWYDEILLPLSASYPVSYFLTWLTTLEVHPPYPYFFVKGLLLVSHSDFALRAPFALAGTASIPLAFLVGRQFRGATLGLWAAAIFAIDPLAVYLSRVVRPYAFLICFELGALYFLGAFFRNGRRRNLAAAAACISGMLLCHYVAIFFMGTVLAAFFVFYLFDRSKENRKVLGALTLYCLAALLPVLYFLVKTFAIRAGWSGLQTFGNVLTEYLKGVYGNIRFIDSLPTAVAVAGWLLVAGGLVRCFFRCRRLCVLLVALFVLPGAAFVIFRHGYYLTAWHLSYLLPAVALGMAWALEGLPWSGRLTPPLAVVGCLLAGVWLMQAAPQFYSPKGYAQAPKYIAKAVPGLIGPKDVTVLDPMEYHEINWYLRQFVTHNPLDWQTVSPGPGEITFHVIASPEGALAHLFKDETDMRQALGPIVSAQEAGTARIYTWRLRREPVTGIDALPFEKTFDALPQHFYRDVDRAEGILIYPYWYKLVTPSKNGVVSSFSYQIENNVPGPQQLQLRLHYINDGQDNWLKIRARFDQEPPFVIFESATPTGPHGEGQPAMVERRLVRERPYRTLRLETTMSCALVTPKYNGGNLDSVGVQDLTVAVRALDGDFFKAATLDRGYTVTGLRDVEADARAKWRWALGAQTEIAFDLPRDRFLVFSFACNNPVPGQSMEISANGDRLWSASDIPVTPWLGESAGATLRFHGKKGHNVLRIAYGGWNGKNGYFNPVDRTPYSVAFTKLRLDRVADEQPGDGVAGQGAAGTR